MQEIIKNICKMVHGPVSAEVTATDFSGMMKEGKYLASIAKNIAVKVPLTNNGLMACKELTSQGIMVNVTLCFSAGQAILAAKAGATYVSPFVGRVDDNSFGGLCLVKDIANIYAKQKVFETQVLAASIRNVRDVGRAFEYGAHICTIPAGVFEKMYKHVLTDQGLDLFDKDWSHVVQ